jgi:hypothetical protein
VSFTENSVTFEIDGDDSDDVALETTTVHVLIDNEVVLQKSFETPEIDMPQQITVEGLNQNTDYEFILVPAN